MSWVGAAWPLFGLDDKERVAIGFLILVNRPLLTAYLCIRYDNGTKVGTTSLSNSSD
jgi:hypothetical protein